MKKLLLIALTFIVYLVAVHRVAGEVPNITLKCYLNLDFSANNTRNTDAEKIVDPNDTILLTNIELEQQLKDKISPREP